MPEVLDERALAAFKVDIARIKILRGAEDGNISRVDPDQLDHAELALWDKLKAIFREVDGSLIDDAKKRSEIITLAKQLSGETQSGKSTSNIDGAASRLAFRAWIGQRIGVLYGLESITDEEKYRDENPEILDGVLKERSGLLGQ